MRFAKLMLNSIVLIFCGGCASYASDTLLSVQDIANSGNSYVGKSVDIKGFIALDALNVPHLYQSQQVAGAKDDTAAIDVTSNDTHTYGSLKGEAPACVVLHGDFHNNSDSIHTGYSKIGLIDVKTFKKC